MYTCARLTSRNGSERSKVTLCPRVVKMKWYLMVYRWRAVSSAAWLCLLSYPLLTIYTALTSFSIRHPITWATDCMYNLLSVFTLFHCCLYALTLVVVMVMYTLTATATLPVYKTRLHVIWSVLSPTHFPCVLLMSLIGVVEGHILSHLSGHMTWSGRGLNERWWFIAIHGAFSGLLFGCRYFIDKQLVLVLPTVQQSRLFSLRGQTLSHVTQGLIQTVKDLRWFCPVYYLTRSYLRSKVTGGLGLEWNNEVTLLNLDLLFQVLLSGTFIHALWTFGLRMFKVFQTQHIAFPVVAMFSNESNRLLTDALKSSIPLLRHLAYFDLCGLAWQTGPRRGQVYSLDRAGLPRVWEEVCSKCLQVIDTLTHKLTGVPAEPVTMATKEGGLGEISGRGSKGWWSPEPPVLTRRVADERVAQLWSYSPPTKVASQRPAEVKPLTKLAADKVHRGLLSVRALPGAVAQRLKRKPFFVHFLSPLADTEEIELYSNSRVVVWAVTGISELAVASYTEDKYGVVQRSLGRVLGSLISLSQALDKHLKTPLSNAPSTSNTLFALERNSKYAINTAVLTSLHRLEATFSKETRAFQLSTDQTKYWTSHT